jgi:hypothetical protein
MERTMDYGATALTIAEAMRDMVDRSQHKGAGPYHVLWNGLLVKQGDTFSAPHRGIVRIDFLSRKNDLEQGVDLKVDKGALRLSGGEEVTLLRTWADDRYEDSVEYPYHSKSGQLWVHNVWKLRFPQGPTRVEKWTGNAGLWIEEIDDRQRIYHCSHGEASQPDFDSLVFRVTVFPLPQS